MPKPQQRKEARNSALLEWCESEFRRFAHIPDPGFIYTTLGVVAANCFKGMPVWLMLVGPSGSFKSSMICALADARPEWFRLLSGASTSSFLSGSSKRDRAKDATGGVLADIASNNVRFLAFKEYGSILDLPKDEYARTSSLFREMWDGRIDRPVGTDGGQMLSWSGKIGNFAACTSRIDDVLADETTKGVRWQLWRFPASDGYHEGQRAMGHDDPTEMKEALATAVETVLDGAGLEWGMDSRVLTVRENTRIIRIASIGARLQGSIRRDRFHRHEILDTPQETYPTRLGPALARIYLGMELVGVEESRRWHEIRKLAFDSAPALRVAVLREYLRRELDGQPGDALGIAESIRCGKGAVQREIEDLRLLGLIERYEDEGELVWRVRKEVKAEIDFEEIRQHHD
jgi:hypothetical protein